MSQLINSPIKCDLKMGLKKMNLMKVKMYIQTEITTNTILSCTDLKI